MQRLPTLDRGDLQLCPVAADDLPRIAEMAGDPATIEDYQLVTTDITVVEQWFQPLVKGDEWGWVLTEHGASVGLVSLEPDGDGGAEVGYFVDAACAGRGLATGAVTAAAEGALTAGGLERITAGVTTRNVASRRVLEKAGFHLTHVAEGDWEWKGEILDSAYYERTS